jgi:hypothetical protein
MGGRSVEKSLATTDRQQAEITALPLIAQHKAEPLEARPRFETSWRPQYEPGREHVKPSGERVIATERELFHLDAKGRITDKTANGGPFHKLVSGKKLTLRSLEQAYGIGRQTVPTKNGDDAILETYLKHANITGHFRAGGAERVGTF